MPVIRVTIQTAGAHSQWTETREGTIRIFIVIALEKRLAILKFHPHAGLFHCRSRLLIRISIDHRSRPQKPAGVILRRMFDARAGAQVNDFVNILVRVLAFASCDGQGDYCQCQIVVFHDFSFYQVIFFSAFTNFKSLSASAR